MPFTYNLFLPVSVDYQPMHTPNPSNPPKLEIINDVRELLRRGEWDAGVLLAVQQMEAWILQGPPGFWERHSGAGMDALVQECKAGMRCYSLVMYIHISTLQSINRTHRHDHPLPGHRRAGSIRHLPGAEEGT